MIGAAFVLAAVTALANPYEGDPAAVRAGAKLYGMHCASCHDADPARRKKAPPLPTPELRGRPDALFRMITNGDLRKGMPAWSRLPAARRWQIVTFLESE